MEDNNRSMPKKRILKEEKEKYEQYAKFLNKIFENKNTSANPVHKVSASQ